MACVPATFRTSTHIKGEACTHALASARFNLHYVASLCLPRLLRDESSLRNDSIFMLPHPAFSLHLRSLRRPSLSWTEKQHTRLLQVIGPRGDTLRGSFEA